jgi:hypothetical protein
VAITRRPTGPRGRQRYSTRVRYAHVSLVRSRAECLKHKADRAIRLAKSTQ